ncbi:MAG: PepSY-like domain-containing protein [Crocinitomicaceae bacterium]|jgi:hypothetical protein|nr:PepSY-like domain-containing protein [Crocinitomicaceae bacterium]
MIKKTIAMSALLIGFAIVSCAQETASKIPTKVEDAFKSKFPNAKLVKWDRENDTEWEVEFKLDGVDYSANFSNEGAWKETEHEIKIKELPEAVQSTLSSEFSGYKIEEAETVESPDFSGYEVEIEKGEESMEVVFDQAGKVIKKKIKEEEDDNEED